MNVIKDAGNINAELEKQLETTFKSLGKRPAVKESSISSRQSL
jgi:hypothetical protein